MKITILTTTRADFSILKPLILRLSRENNINCQTVVSGSHLSKKFGYTVRDIIENKIKISKKIMIKNLSNNSYHLLRDSKNLSIEFFKYLSKFKPDVLIILGDRFEILSCAISAFLSRVKIAHIHGGELTSGSMDDTFRHCISKLSNIHFVSHPSYKKRLIQLGEDPKKIFTFGGLGAENIKKSKFLPKKKIEEKFKFKFTEKNILVNIQPVTYSSNETGLVIRETLKALSEFKKMRIIFTYPGVDLNSNDIIKNIKTFVKKNTNSVIIKSFGDVYYYSLLNYVDCIVGNSSSGILEMPSFKKYTINIGSRQKGRIQSNSILNSKAQKKNIIKLIKKAINIKKTTKKDIKNLFYKKNTTENIIRVIKDINLKDHKNKTFFDLKF